MVLLFENLGDGAGIAVEVLIVLVVCVGGFKEDELRCCGAYWAGDGTVEIVVVEEITDFGDWY